MKLLIPLTRMTAPLNSGAALTLMVILFGPNSQASASADTLVSHFASMSRTEEHDKRSDVPNNPTHNATRLEDPFGQTAPATRSAISFKWIELRSRLEEQEHALATCIQGKVPCSPAVAQFLEIIEMAKGREGRSRLGEINRAVNLAIRSVSDAQQYGSSDWWAGPIELFQRKAGDCEDYAIAKYVALRMAGVPVENVRLVFVRDLKRQIDHAIVTVLLDSQWLILDNRTLIMVEAREALHYLPLVVMDDRGLRQFVNIECDAAGFECFS